MTRGKCRGIRGIVLPTHFSYRALLYQGLINELAVVVLLAFLLLSVVNRAGFLFPSLEATQFDQTVGEERSSPICSSGDSVIIA
ncbi:hypothetical protein K457DRAFT_579430 [Linnemannia elongata AG-77]|uniref:Uncharacterized protein n=1 Tax=Linnemannia elongata AG-77 TaxID=1314771 RepID=A0A197KCS1_9FUNG|nr:hypothetical protein K457DRAFT_579430 [Linnemannia elongata AG-77]